MREAQQDIFAYILRQIQKIIRYFLVEQADIGIFNEMIVIAQAAVTAASQGRSDRTAYEDVVRGGEGDEIVCQRVRTIEAVAFVDIEERCRQIAGDRQALFGYVFDVDSDSIVLIHRTPRLCYWRTKNRDLSCGAIRASNGYRNHTLVFGETSILAVQSSGTLTLPACLTTYMYGAKA